MFTTLQYNFKKYIKFFNLNLINAHFLFILYVNKELLLIVTWMTYTFFRNSPFRTNNSNYDEVEYKS